MLFCLKQEPVMPKVVIEHSCVLNAEDAFAKIKTFFSSDQDIRRFDPKMQCEFSDSSMTGKALGGQFKADILVRANGAGSQVEITVDLPFILTPVKGKVQETIKRKLTKYLS
jgi:hypothetical protein